MTRAEKSKPREWQHEVIDSGINNPFVGSSQAYRIPEKIVKQWATGVPRVSTPTRLQRAILPVVPWFVLGIALGWGLTR